MASNVPKRGRPKAKEQERRILLNRQSTFDLWNQRKDSLGIKGLSNNAFAEILLHQSLEDLRARCSSYEANDEEEVTSSRRQLFQSTPLRKRPRMELDISPVPELRTEETNTFVDVTGNTVYSAPAFNMSLNQESFGKSTFHSASSCMELNPAFASLSGNPFMENDESEVLSDVSCEEYMYAEEALEAYSSSSDDTASDCEFREEDEQFEDEPISSIELSNSATLTALDLDVDDLPSSSSIELSDSATLTALDLDVDVSTEDSLQHPTPEKEPTGETNSANNEEDNQDPQVQPVEPKAFGPVTLEEHKEALQLVIKKDFEELQKCEEDLKKYQALYAGERVMVDVEYIIQMCEGVCEKDNCYKKRNIVNHKLEGGVLSVSYRCEEGHDGIWYSSKILGEKNGQKLFVSSTLLAAATLITGNNYEKLSLFAKCLNLNFVSQSTFSRIQTHYVIPSIKELWGQMKEKIWNLFKTEVLVLCGDGRMDSPGFSAKYCLYSMMDHFLDLIVDVEVVDKREAGGTSSLMEKMGCKRILERMIGVLNAQELVTDASSVIMKMVRELKGQNCEVLEHFFHSLDMWHKSVKLTAKLSAASKIKGCEALAQWIQPIRNHFWHCAEACEGDVTKLKRMWIGIVHHVCGEHEWDDGECSHGQLTVEEGDKEILAKDSKAAEELRKIVFDRDWLKSLEFYIYFRHTSKLENFNSMVLKYASKRIAFSYEVYTGRCLLAALDHNFHLFRKTIEGRYKKLYSKRSGNWRAEEVKEDKNYTYWPVLMSEILRKRINDKETTTRPVVLSPTNPKHLAPTIAMKESPATEDLVAAKLSRFQKQKSEKSK